MTQNPSKENCDCRAKLKSLESNDSVGAGGGMSSDIDDDGDYSSIDSRDPKM